VTYTFFDDTLFPFTKICEGQYDLTVLYKICGVSFGVVLAFCVLGAAVLMGVEVDCGVQCFGVVLGAGGCNGFGVPGVFGGIRGVGVGVFGVVGFGV